MLFWTRIAAAAYSKRSEYATMLGSNASVHNAVQCDCGSYGCRHQRRQSCQSPGVGFRGQMCRCNGNQRYHFIADMILFWGQTKMPPKKIHYVQLILILIIFNVAFHLQAEFYKYVDEEGQTFFVEDLSRVPPEYRNRVEVYKEKFDHLPAEQRKTQLENEQQQQQALELERQLQMQQELQQAAEQEEAERKRLDQLAKARLQATPVIIKGNRVYVPTTIGNNGVEVQTLLLLDTGASQTVVHRNIAGQLNITALKKGLSQVAGGQKIYTEMGKVDYIKIGPHTLKRADILIINHEGAAVAHSGLLGMNILRNFNYNIDFENQMMLWQPVE